MTKRGTLYGISLGPGDPGLITRAAWEALQRRDAIWVYPARSGKTPKVPQLEATESQLDKFKPDDKKGANTETPAAPLAPLPPSYPPLESGR